MDVSAARFGGAALLLATITAPALGQDSANLGSASGETLYQAACANCHGVDGTGVSPEMLAFAEAMPDFTDCDFAVREPDGDWIAVAHEGGPVRGFSAMMPAFRGALSVEQLERLMGYIRTMCTDPRWPAGELNLPRALITEKAYPEDEWVVETGASLTGDGAFDVAYVYERRFGPRSQWEVVIPFGWRGGPDDESGTGLGDVVVGVKHAAYHDKHAGRILSFGAEVFVPTGNEDVGLGKRGVVTEAFTSIGQVLPSDAFVQAQAGIEMPIYEGGDTEAFGRLALGRTFVEDTWGRSWTPMVELAAKREPGGPLMMDVVPQVQVSVNTRQHVLANVGVLVPAKRTGGRSVRLMAYVLLDWFDGGFWEGW